MTTPITTLIVDDEQHARTALKNLLSRHPAIDIVAECENGKDAVKAVNEREPALVFLDIQMPKLDGFEVLELLGDKAPLVVFVTAHDDYAIQAFENNALDYLLKPVSPERLAETVARASQRLADHQPQQREQQAMLTDIRRQQGHLSRILVRDKGDVHVIPAADIIAIEAADDYVVIHTPAGNHIKQERLGRLEESLDPQQFCRIHRSCLINLDFLSNIETEGKDTRFAHLKSGQSFAISRSGYSKLLERL
ncbi:LytR/AlgR family response regulator transcription factor [Simiduia agarivorans]|uniref:Response regulator receiver domain-containing protein n=1 Tax=Simiduia agarivorans (strain DSM 21679 / JCM 13881 / BCRC 17597 / SA1) TaxID=1117647 RepID=K4KX73_SIMAS|nr:response regulator [Simiduia agarivorans]AFU98542.1 response regulator receiver domain-containing protein [Simiduia agarivorans SA1 = DSM 21679]